LHPLRRGKDLPVRSFFVPLASDPGSRLKFLHAPPLAVPPRPAAVDPNLPAVTALAPESRSTSKAEVPPTPLELRVGKMVAMTASAIAAGVQDYANNGGMTVATKVRTADCISELYKLRCLMVPFWDFDAIGHQLGRESLIEFCGAANDTERAIIDELVNTVMQVLRKAVLAELN